MPNVSPYHKNLAQLLRNKGSFMGQAVVGNPYQEMSHLSIKSTNSLIKWLRPMESLYVAP
jgi:hypothetical protein